MKNPVEEFKHGTWLIQRIKEELSVLRNTESIPLNSDNCAGFGIHTGFKSHTINKIDKNGFSIVYENHGCKTFAFAGHPHSVFAFPNYVLDEILKCCVEYNKSNSMSEKDLSHLQVILKNLEPSSELSESMKKAIHILGKLE